MEETFVVLKTKLGQLRGQVKTTRLTQETYYAFQGIPYAKPPLGDLRFKAPQPFGGWEGVRDATKDGNGAMQPPKLTQWPAMDINQIVSIGDEDCLYLSVCMREIPNSNSSKKPVMFHIHGGGFLFGEGGFKLCGPDFIMSENVVMVSINYRCGAFGFLSLENEKVPGNAGLKDQTLALQWVRDNIDSFGGDSNNVTIFGISAGGASVHYHLLSESSKGLFHKAIMQSGFANINWTLQPVPRKIAIRLAKSLGCSSEDNDEVLDFLRSVSASDIVEATTRLVLSKKELMHTMSLIFSPCMEVAGTSPFLTETPDTLMKNGQFNKVPVILGCTLNEGSVASYLVENLEELFKNISEIPELLVPPFLGLTHESSEEKEAGEAIRDFYFKDNNCINIEMFLGDIHFNVSMERTRKYLLEKGSSPLFSYLFTNNSLMEAILGKEGKNKEADHGSDIPYLFEFGLYPHLEITPNYRTWIQKHVKAWTTFASNGYPSSEMLDEAWEVDSKAKPCFMQIGPNWTMKSGIPFGERCEFWNQLAAKYVTG